MDTEAITEESHSGFERSETITEESPEESHSGFERSEPIEEPIEEEPKESGVKNIPRKRIVDLTTAERELLIESAKRGEFNDNYKVKLFKNGNSRIVKNGSSLDYTPTVPIVTPKKTSQTNSSNTLSNDQFLMQHIIGLEARFAKMTMKHKKLKNKYLELESSMFVDDGYVEDEPVQEPEPEPVKQIVKQPVYEEPTYEEPIRQNSIRQPAKNRGWRATLMNSHK